MAKKKQLPLMHWAERSIYMPCIASMLRGIELDKIGKQTTKDITKVTCPDCAAEIQRRAELGML